MLLLMSFKDRDLNGISFVKKRERPGEALSTSNPLPGY